MSKEFCDERDVCRFANKGDITNLTRLLMNGVSPNVTDYFGNTFFHLAAYKGNIGCTIALLKYGADPNAFYMTKFSPLYCAVKGKHYDCIEILLQHSVKTIDINEAYEIADEKGKQIFDDYFASPEDIKEPGFD